MMFNLPNMSLSSSSHTDACIRFMSLSPLPVYLFLFLASFTESAFPLFLAPHGFTPCCGYDKLSAPFGERKKKKRVCSWFLDPAGPPHFTAVSAPDGPGRLHWAHCIQQLICSDCLDLLGLSLRA